MVVELWDGVVFNALFCERKKTPHSAVFLGIVSEWFGFFFLNSMGIGPNINIFSFHTDKITFNVNILSSKGLFSHKCQ